MSTTTLPDPAPPLGLEALARLLLHDYPELAISRHALRRLCMAGRMPCTQIPPLTGRTPRYRVTARDAVRTLRNLRIA